MKINGIDITGFVHPAVKDAVADECLELGINETKQNEDGDVWDGPKLLPRSARVVSATAESGVIFKVVLADGREDLHSLSAERSMKLERQGFIG